MYIYEYMYIYIYIYIIIIIIIIIDKIIIIIIIIIFAQSLAIHTFLVRCKFQNIYISALWSPFVNPAGKTFPNSRMKNFFCLSVGGLSKMLQGGNYQDLLKWGGVFLGHSLITTKWTWENFTPKSAIWPSLPTPPLYSTYNYAQKSTKKRWGICLKLTIKIKTSECHQYFSMFSFQWGPFDIFFNFKQISQLGLIYIAGFGLNR